MTGLGILKQAYSLLGDEVRMANADSDEAGLAAINQIYSELWHREHRTLFKPLSVLQQPVALSWRALPALTYGTAALLSVAKENRDAHDRFLALYHWAASHAGGVYENRRDTLWTKEKP